MDINLPLLLVYILAILIEIGLPICLAVYLIKKYPSSWIMVVTGVFTYAIAQLVHTPALNGVAALFSNGTLASPSEAWLPFVNAGLVGLLAAVIEEGVRWIGFRLTKPYAKPFRSGVGLGIGHGGSEMLIVGGLVAYNLATVLFYNPGKQIATGTDTATVQAVLSQIAAYWGTTWWVGLIGIFEKVVQFAAQMVFSLLVWRSIAKDSPVWFLAAIIYHMVISGITTLLNGLGWNFWQIEGILALTLLLNIWILYWFWGDEGGLDSEGDEDEDDEDEDEEEDEEGDEEPEVKKAPAAKKKTAAAIAADMKKKTVAKKPAAKKPAAPKKKPVKKAE
jgi:uncharacterized membrane protein YhfC